MTAIHTTKSPRPRLLCVDDETNVLSGLQLVLRKTFDVSVATSGQQALGILTKDGPFDLIISDFAMPVMSGSEFLALSRLVAPNATRILLTGHASLEAAQDAVNEGHIFRLLTKPCPPDELLRNLQDALEQARVEQEEQGLLVRKLDAAESHLIRAQRLTAASKIAEDLGRHIQSVLASMHEVLHRLHCTPSDAAEAAEELQALTAHLNKPAQLLTQLQNLGGKTRPGPASLSEAVREVVYLFRSAGVLQNIDVEVHEDGGAFSVTLAELELRQVLTNLFANAVACLRETEAPRVRVELSRSAGECVLTIQDNGPGISPAIRPIVFEPYFSTHDEGGGLGLYAAKRILDIVGGAISVCDSVVGARLEVRIPTP